jgi:hypothetical protein
MASRLVLLHLSRSEETYDSRRHCSQVTLNHGRQREYYGQDRFKHQRSVAVLPGMKMIGLTGEVDSVHPSILYAGYRNH